MAVNFNPKGPTLGRQSELTSNTGLNVARPGAPVGPVANAAPAAAAQKLPTLQPVQQPALGELDWASTAKVLSALNHSFQLAQQATALPPELRKMMIEAYESGGRSSSLDPSTVAAYEQIDHTNSLFEEAFRRNTPAVAAALQTMQALYPGLSIGVAQIANLEVGKHLEGVLVNGLAGSQPAPGRTGDANALATLKRLELEGKISVATSGVIAIKEGWLKRKEVEDLLSDFLGRKVSVDVAGAIHDNDGGRVGLQIRQALDNTVLFADGRLQFKSIDKDQAGQIKIGPELVR